MKRGMRRGKEEEGEWEGEGTYYHFIKSLYISFKTMPLCHLAEGVTWLLHASNLLCLLLTVWVG